MTSPSSTRPTAPALAGLPPGPRGLPLVGVLPQLRNDPLRLLPALHRKYGDLVNLGVRGLYLATHPDDIRRILVETEQFYIKGPLMDQLRAGLGNGLLTSTGSFWRRQRKLSQPAFHRQRLAQLGAVMTSATAAMLERWREQLPDGRPLNIAAELMRLTFTIVARALFSVEAGDDAATISRAMRVVLPITERRFWALLNIPEQVPTPDNVRFRRSMAAMDQVVYRIIAEHRRSAGYQDLLSMLMQTRDEETGESMSDSQLRDEVLTLLLAGHDTTSNLLAWTFYLLSKHPQVERKLHAEARGVLGGRLPTVEDLASLPYTRMVIDEVMRLYPPAWIMSRSPTADDTLRGYRVPAGSVVLLSPYVTHRHPAYWENPEGFDPERFAPGADADRPRYAYFPFGGGPRVCIGNHFALMEAQIVLAALAQRVSFALLPGQRIEPEPLVTLRPRHGVRVRVARR